MVRGNVADLAGATVGASFDHPPTLFNVRGSIYHYISLPRPTVVTLHRYSTEHTIFLVKKFEKDGRTGPKG
jgi:hypothetical protein